MADIRDKVSAAVTQAQGDRYSPNLRSWLIKNMRPWGMPIVYRDRDQMRWIGWIDEGMWFIGQRLSRVMSFGRKAEVGCWTFPISDLTEDDDFWDRYLAIGRCAIDERHEGFFIGEETRWKQDGDARECLWCGNHRQRLRRWQKVIDCQAWEPSTPTHRPAGREGSPTRAERGL